MKLVQYMPGSCCDPGLTKFLEFEVNDLSEIPMYLPNYRGYTFKLSDDKTCVLGHPPKGMYPQDEKNFGEKWALSDRVIAMINH